ncbi:co-chaperonin [Helicobacter fennelliae]|uniref:Co-chaperonin GroES n=2 Tax=Helicobacter fennelliae TaxID=215 RepID=T1CML4_9HELI|nr:heat shock protein 60 family co-chaperone GroES [Helicobacter fennelliae MRY12-0050]SQB99514.1 co-chaperonin [Helicobacter fennelliae]STP07531.1 co-chaperonin [Helicobacter fennelliae]STQ85053.1 co-chaperonin [Helicobacter fennelliae]
MKFKPLGERVLVERLEEESKTSSGIIIPDNAKEKPLMGKVVAVSKQVADEKTLKENETIVFGKYAGSEIKLNNKEYIVLEVKDVLGVIG